MTRNPSSPPFPANADFGAFVPAGLVDSPDCLKSHVLISDGYSKAPLFEPTWRLGKQKEFFPGSAEGSVVELPALPPSQRNPQHGTLADLAPQQRLMYVARLERTATHCTAPAVGHCSGKMYVGETMQTREISLPRACARARV